MNKQKVPKLRFPGFTGEWQEKTFLELSENGFSNGVFNDPKMVGSGYKLINVKEMYEGDVIDYKNLTLVNIPKNEFEKNKVLKGDIFFTRSSLVKDGIAFSNIFIDDFEDVTYDGHLIRMRPNKKILESKYFSYQLKTPDIRRQLVVRGKTTTMTTIGQDDIATVEVNIPTLPEQKRIAEFLSDIDTKIEKLTSKKELTEQYKKGTMQKIFSQKIRFKVENGKNYPDWEEKRLGDFVISYRGGASLTPNDFTSTGIKVLPKSGVGAGGILNISVDKQAYCSYEYAESNKMSQVDKRYTITVLRDLVPSGPSIGYVVRIIDDKKYILAQGVYGLLLKEDELLPSHLINFSNSTVYRRLMQTILVGSTQVHIRTPEYLNILIPLPSLSEQKKISDFLVDLDTRIQHIDKELAKLKEYKKGLLQGMFV